MSDIKPQGSESLAAPAIDLTKYVPKEDFEKAQTAQEKLKSELDQAKMSLLDPEYISYLESKRTKAQQATAKIPDGTDLTNLTPQQLLEMATAKAVELVESRSGERFRKIETAVSDVLAVMELKAVEERYKDFNDYREDIAKILEDPRSNLTIEQAYRLAKQSKSEKEEAKEPEKKPTLSEKPTGSIPAERFQPKSFKSADEASLDAWDQIVGRGKDSL